jgi:2-amino-4-hydroxy-6-hydroxymethyldihydropteridine diphosphokinase / dihydropteroate synthase
MIKRVALGIGTNSGDRIKHLRAAIAKIKTEFKLSAVSPIYESKAMLPDGAPIEWDKNFLNLVALIDTSLSPQSVLIAVKKIEKEMGRTNRERWAPREIDIDLLAFESESLVIENLQIPHVGLKDRPFALLPLADVWPDWVYPDFSNKTALQLASQWLWSTQLPFETKKTRLSLTEIISILNITPDSFSGDGLSHKPIDEIASLVQRHLEAGASVLDIGAESTRPDATSLTFESEWQRLKPFFDHVWPAFRGQVKLSLDSRHPENIERAFELGLEFINDVSGFSNHKMFTLARTSNKKFIAMHSLTIPASRDVVLSDDQDPVQVILEWGRRKIKECLDFGISIEQIMLDPGIGFGKTPAQNVHLLRQVHRFHEWHVPLLIGHSRKSLFSLFTEAQSAERDFETAVVSSWLAQNGVEFVRVHNPQLTKRAFAVQNFFQPYSSGKSQPQRESSYGSDA